MILVSLSMKNFKQYRDETIEFREGLIGIIGKNGAGKSTLFDAVLLALYGELPFNKEHIRNSTAGEKETVSVALEFETGNRRYRAVREYRGKSLTAYGRLYDHLESLITEGQKETTAEVTRLLGMDGDAFTRSIFAGQKELGAISGSRGAERRELVRRMIGMERLDAIQKMVRADCRRVEDELAGMERLLLSPDDIAGKTERITALKKKIQTLENQANALAEKHAAAQNAYSQAKKDFGEQQTLYRTHTAANTKLVKAAAETEHARKTLASAAARLKELDALKRELTSMGPALKEYGTIRKQKEKMDTLYNKFRERAGLLSQMEEHGKELGSIAAEIEKEKLAAAALRDTDTELTSAREALNRVGSHIEEAGDRIVILKADAGRLHQLIGERRESIEKISSAGRDSECPTCLRPLRDAYNDTLERLTADIERYQTKELTELSVRLKEAQSGLRRLQDEKKNIETAMISAQRRSAEREQLAKSITSLSERMKEKSSLIKRLEASLRSLGDVDYDAQLHSGIKERLAELEETHNRSLELSGKVKEIPTLQRDIASLTESIARLEAEERARRDELAAIPYSEKTYHAAEQTQSRCEAARDCVRDELEKGKIGLRDTRQELSIVEKELKEDGTRRGQLEKFRAESVALRKLEIHMDGFKTAVLERVRPSIARYAGDLFQRCTRGRYESIRVNEDFDFFILDDGEYYPINRFSGGEVDLANLCLRVAISRVIAEMSGAGPTGFMGFDEIFGSQDSERRAEILAAFQHLRERYRQIFIVSHIDEIKEEFPVILEVRRAAGGSTVRWVEG